MGEWLVARQFSDSHRQEMARSDGMKQFTGVTGEVLIASHRGEWKEHPENSLSAIDKAIQIGAHIVEIDIHPTKDGELILMHDPTVDRMTNGKGKISELTLAEIRSLRLRMGQGGENAPLSDESVPTLREAMERTRNKILVNIDKCWKYRDKVWDILELTDTTDQSIFKGTALNAEVEPWLASKAYRPIYMHIVLDKNVHDLPNIMWGTQPVAYELVFATLQDQTVSDEIVSQIQATGKRIWINMMFKQFVGGWTDEPSGWDWCMQRGASILLTDRSEELLTYTQQKDRAAVANKPIS